MRSFSALLSIAFAASAVLTSPSASCQSRQLSDGARVRLVASSIDKDQQIARIVSSSNDTLSFRSETYPVTRSIALSSVEAIEVSSGVKRNTRNGLIIGLLVGATAGAIDGSASYRPCSNWCIVGPASKGQAALLGGTIGGLLGVITGSIAGYFIKTERWERIDFGARASVTPVHGGAALTVSRSF